MDDLFARIRFGAFRPILRAVIVDVAVLLELADHCTAAVSTLHELTRVGHRVRLLIAAKAPLDHVNNLKWTALMETIVLGNGGERHTEILRALVNAGADVNIPDGSGSTPLKLAR